MKSLYSAGKAWHGEDYIRPTQIPLYHKYEFLLWVSTLFGMSLFVIIKTPTTWLWSLWCFTYIVYVTRSYVPVSITMQWSVALKLPVAERRDIYLLGVFSFKGVSQYFLTSIKKPFLDHQKTIKLSKKLLLIRKYFKTIFNKGPLKRI